MQNTIRLNIIHPDKARVEHFLNNVGEALEQIPFDARELNGVDENIPGFKFSVKNRAAFVFVILAGSYSDATKIEAANLAARPNINWTINGAILFGVEPGDEEASREMLSYFVGRE